MGKTSEEKRSTAQNFHAGKQSPKKPSPFSLSDAQIRAAAQFALETSPEKAAENSGLALGVLQKIANGNFTASGNQIPSIVNAASKMGWTPPEA